MAKPKKESVILIIGMKNKSDCKFMLDTLKKMTRKYSCYVLGVLEEEPFKEFVSNFWAKDQLLKARHGKLEYSQAAKYLVFKPNWKYNSKYLNKKPPDKILKRDRAKMIKEIAKTCTRAIFFVQWGASRKENLYKKLRKKGMPCKTIFCPESKSGRQSAAS